MAKAVTVPTENLVSYTYDAPWTEEGTVTLTLTAARTSKGNDTHIAKEVSFTAGTGIKVNYLKTFCGLEPGQRVHHTIWSVAPSRITCEKCNGTKAKKAARDSWSKIAAVFAAK